MKDYQQRVHLVCAYMKRWRDEAGECQECPHWEPEEVGGHKVQRMCRGIAEEAMSVVIHGTPWPKRAKLEAVPAPEDPAPPG